MEAHEKLAALADVKDFNVNISFKTSSCHEVSSGKTYEIKSLRPDQISMQQREQLVDMVEADLKDLYNDAWGWDRPGKIKELFASTSNFMVAKDSQGKIVGFIMFRFCYDDNEEPEFPVLYVYELNVAASERGSGLGRRLMELMFAIETKWKLWKIMLTCFKGNTNAIAFYNKMGFDVDVYSPSRCDGWEPVKYEIMSNHPDRTDEY